MMLMGRNFKTIRDWRPQEVTKQIQQSFNIVDTSNILGKQGLFVSLFIGIFFRQIADFQEMFACPYMFD